MQRQETFSHTSGKSINEIAKDLGISCSMLARWERGQEEYGPLLQKDRWILYETTVGSGTSY